MVLRALRRENRISDKCHLVVSVSNGHLPLGLVSAQLGFG